VEIDTCKRCQNLKWYGWSWKFLWRIAKLQLEAVVLNFCYLTNGWKIIMCQPYWMKYFSNNFCHMSVHLPGITWLSHPSVFNPHTSFSVLKLYISITGFPCLTLHWTTFFSLFCWLVSVTEGAVNVVWTQINVILCGFWQYLHWLDSWVF